ncbi:protein disulfide-isomerase domain [Rhizophagus clarus]|uniref:Protein disulfide-isomerase domain n=1 Tax=Rhizophagus clarus TaxID=94130 RepID=A0A8H3M6D9_9GLOM|nr:protein disulfide-isomerase domain [Rhizophagus clarus]
MFHKNIFDNYYEISNQKVYKFSFEVIELSAKDFKEAIKEGTWFVKFFAPWCPHCQSIAPIWTRVAVENGNYFKSKNFYVAEVDCTLNGDLCDANNIERYPTMLLFNEGVKVDLYSSKRDFDSFTTYAKSKADQYYTPAIEDLKDPSINTNSDHDNETLVQTNPLGTVVLLNASNFDLLTKTGIWFIKFFAPWCTHCQRLAPTWEELGHELQYKVNVGKVDCTVDSGLCQRFNVQGYPTLKLLQSPDDIIEYKGSRQLSSLRDFAEKAADARVLDISVTDLDRIKKTDDVFFIYLYDDNTPFNILETIKGLSRSFFSVKFYSSKDPNLTAQLKIVKLPALVVLKDELQKNYPSTSVESFLNRDALKNWIQSEKYSLVPAMDSENYEDILGGDRLVVLGVFRSFEGTQIKAKKSLKDIAKLYYQQIKERSGSEDGRSVIFAWLDGTRWSDYIHRVYGLSKKDLPTVLIADPVSNKYFDTTRSGQKLNLMDQEQLLESIHDAKKGYLVGKSTMGFVERIFMDMFSYGEHLQKTVIKHPFVSLIVFSLVVGVVYRYCIVPQIRDVRDYEMGYSNSKVE